MSHFIRCDRCDKQTVVIGKLSLPPGWQTICYADLCEPCCQLVHDFVRFRSSDAARLPVEPIEEVAQIAPVGDALFEIAPEPAPQVSADSHEAERMPAMGSLAHDSATAGAPTGPTQPVSAESSSEEINREKRRKTKARLQGQDAILPDPRHKPDERPGEPGRSL